MSILEKLSIISDRLDDSDLNLDYIDVAAIFFMNSLPYEISKEYFTEHTFNNDGISCGTKYSDVLRNGEECRKIRSSLRFRAKKENSQYRATEDDPVFYKKAGFLYVLPEKQSDSDEFIVTKIPETFIEKSETTPITGELINAPKDSEQIILLYSGHIILYKKARDKREYLYTYVSSMQDLLSSYDLMKPELVPVIEDFIFDRELPQVPDVSVSLDEHIIDLNDLDSTEVSTGDLDNINIDLGVEFGDIVEDINESLVLNPDFSFVIPDLDLSTIDVPNPDLQEAQEAIENAYSFIGGIETNPSTGENEASSVPKGAFWLNDEDPEMVNSAVGLASQEVNRANSIASTQLSTLNTYKSQIDGKIAEFNAKVQAQSSKIDLEYKKMQGLITEFQSKIDAKVKELQSRVAVINGKIQEIQSKVSKETSSISSKIQTKSSKNQVILEREKLKLTKWQSNFEQKLQSKSILIQNFQNEINSYSTDFQTSITKWSSNAENKFKVFEYTLNLSVSEFQKLQVISSKYQVDSQEYNQLISESNQMYQKYQNEYQKFLGYYGSNKDN